MTLALPLFVVTLSPAAMALPSAFSLSQSRSPKAGGPLGSDVTMTAVSSNERTISIAEVDRYIAAAALKHGVSDDLIRAIIQTESEFDPLALSSKGACGLMQLMPPTARRFGVADCFDARQNILAGTRYLKELLTRYEGSVPLSVAAYNAGEGAVARHGGIPPYRQTRAYVRKVTTLLLVASAGAGPEEAVEATS